MSIVAMKKKMEAKRGVSVGGGFSLNGKYKYSNARVTSVKASKVARDNHFKSRACFNGREGFQCERVWDGKKMPQNCETCGDPMTQEEYISEKRYTVSRCRNLLWTEANLGQTLKIVSDGRGGYLVEFGGKQHVVHWNRDVSVISAMVDGGNNEFVLQSIGVTGARETIIKNVNNNDTLSLRNPEIAIQEVQCINDKAVYVNKDRLFEPNGYGGLGGYLDDLKQPNTDENWCG